MVQLCPNNPTDLIHKSDQLILHGELDHAVLPSDQDGGPRVWSGNATHSDLHWHVEGVLGGLQAIQDGQDQQFQPSPTSNWPNRYNL